MGDSPAVIIYGSDGIGGFEEKGKQHPFKIDGYGTAGSPVGGVVSIQGVSGGQAVPVSGLPASLGQKAMSASLPVVIASDQIPFSNIVNTGTITALNGTVSVSAQGWNSCMVVITGTWVATLMFEVSADGGVTWISGAFAIPPATVSPMPVPAPFVTSNGTYQGIGLGAVSDIRIKASLFTSGTVGIRLVFGMAPAGLMGGFSSFQQNIMASLSNNSVTNLAVGASFTGTGESTLGVAGLQISTKASQPLLIQVQQSTDNTNWDISDEMTILADGGDNRIFQAVSSYFRVIITNLGNATTSYLRLQSSLCPVVEVLPRALTPTGKLKLASRTYSWAPNPFGHLDRSIDHSLLMDTDRNLNVRARCLTDELSFRSDFSNTNPYVDGTGTYYFTNGSKIVTGSGTLFISELNKQRYIKISGHADSVYMAIDEIVSDTYLLLTDDYTGATASGTGRSSDWSYIIDSGGGITHASSEVLLASGTTSGTIVEMHRDGDYLPYTIGFKARITQRIVNQEAIIGLADGYIGAANNQAVLVFDGYTNTTVKFRTSSTLSDTEITTVTLPYSVVSSTAIVYTIEVLANKVVLFANESKLVEHKLHIPSPYGAMDVRVCIKNTGTAASNTILGLDNFWLANFDRVEVATASRGDPLHVKELRASLAISTNVSALVADTTLLIANPNRLSYSVYNDSIATLYLKHGSNASLTSFKVALSRYDYYEFTGYTGRVNGYWSAATGSARITEET